MASSRDNLSEKLTGIDVIKNKSGGITGYKFRCCVGREKTIDENGLEHVKQVWRTLYVPKNDSRIADRRIDNTIKKLVAYRTEWAEQQKKEYEFSKSEGLRKTNRRTKINPDTMSFRSFVNDHWLKNSIIGDPDHKPSTVNYYQFMAKDLIEYFGDVKLVDIDAEDIVQYTNYLKSATTKNGKPLSATTQLRHYQALHTAFKYAKRMGFIKDDPLASLTSNEKPKEDKDREIDFLNTDDARRFIECLNEEPLFWRAFLSVLMTCGLRRGECLGLQWRDINDSDPAKPTIKVSRNVTVDKTSDEKIHIGTTKSGKDRVVALPAEVYRLLVQQRQSQEELLNISIPDDAFIFCRVENPLKPIYPTEPTRFMRKFVKRHNLPDVSPHDLRHTAATLAIESGRTEDDVQSLLGHADKETSRKFYIGITEEMKRRKEEADRQTVEGIANLLFGKKEHD